MARQYLGIKWDKSSWAMDACRKRHYRDRIVVGRILCLTDEMDYCIRYFQMKEEGYRTDQTPDHTFYLGIVEGEEGVLHMAVEKR